MNSPSIEFDKVKEDSAIPAIIRQSFRIPVESNPNVGVKIGHVRYPLQDICAGGIGLSIKDKSIFSMDQALDNCELILFDLTIENLKGRVVHVSTIADGEWHYGIQWMDPDAEASAKISSVVRKMKESLLAAEEQSEEPEC